MQRYGQLIQWGCVSTGPLPPPVLFTGNILSYGYDLGEEEKLLDDGAGDNQALALFGAKAELDFEAEVTSGTDNFMDLSAGAALAVTGTGIVDTGMILASYAGEKWSEGQKKTASVRATHYINMPTSNAGASAGITANAFTPTQTGLTVVTPGATIIYGTYGMTHAAGIVHDLTIEQFLTLQPDTTAPDGTIQGAGAFGYLRRIQLGIIATAAAPALGSTLTITDGPANAADYLVKKVSRKWAKKREMMYAIEAVWIPAFS